jgi:tripartite-type tricarboxylate transporter receptor subunit TctC
MKINAPFLTLSGVAVVASLSAAPSKAQAQWPSKSITLVVPQAVGGANDTVARLLAPRLAYLLKQAVVVENRVGAGGNLGTAAVARAPKDGYTLLLTAQSAQTINPALYGTRAGFDAQADFDAITIVATAPYVLVTNPAFPAKSVAELLAYVKERPGQVNYASAGNGTLNHLLGEMFKQKTSTFMVHIPYRGAAASATDVVSGQVPLTFGSLPGVMPFVRNGQLKLLGTAAPTRSALIPDTPSIGETIKGFGAISWYGLLAPKGVPKAVIERLSSDVQKIVSSREYQEKLALQGAEPVSGITPLQFDKVIKDELLMWGKVVKESRAQID